MPSVQIRPHISPASFAVISGAFRSSSALILQFTNKERDTVVRIHFASDGRQNPTPFCMEHLRGIRFELPAEKLAVGGPFTVFLEEGEMAFSNSSPDSIMRRKQLTSLGYADAKTFLEIR